jgi:hypothetical protein
MAGAQPSSLVTWAPWCVIDVVRSKKLWLMLVTMVKIRHGVPVRPSASPISIGFSLGYSTE